jgi:hypothetical protein
MKQKAQHALEDLDLVEAALRSLEENRRTLAEELEALKTAQIPLGLAISARKLLEGEMKSRGWYGAVLTNCAHTVLIAPKIRDNRG